MQASLADWMEQKRTARSELLPVPLLPFWPWALTRFYVAPGSSCMSRTKESDNGSAWAGASHRSVLAPLADVPVEWDRSPADIASRVVGFAADTGRGL